MLRLNRVIRSIPTTFLGSNNSSSNNRQLPKPGPMVAADSKAGDEAANPLLLEASLLLLLVLRDKVAGDLMRSRELCKLRRRSVVSCSGWLGFYDE